ncbi:MAG: hypothetical protein EKK48_25995 [Candidatus Melainabacteria bacterium]|nr:MAG: hypothetical protein EKK48_25995 [Candidatus Melainabacteria bacterium]
MTEDSAQKFDFGKISVTAKLVAFFRGFSDIPFASEVAELIGAEDAVRKIVEKSDIDIMPRPRSAADLSETVDEKHYQRRAQISDGDIYAPLFEARYKSIAELIRQSGLRQVLELASGFSLRGLAMTSDPNLVYVESDLQELNSEKRELVRSIRAKFNLPDLGNHHLADANALSLSDLEGLIDCFSIDEKLIVVTEGLLMYLSVEERARVAENVYSLLKRFGGGAWITPDFTTRSLADNVPDAVKRFRSAILGRTERQLFESAFENETEMERFFSSMGFRSECENQMDVVKKLSCVEALDINQAILDRLRPRMNLWTLKPS